MVAVLSTERLIVLVVLCMFMLVDSIKARTRFSILCV